MSAFHGNLNFIIMLSKKVFWTRAFEWGALGGVVLFLISLLTVLAGWQAGFAATLITVLIYAALIYVTGRQNAVIAGRDGYPYARAFGFALAMMLFVGLVSGIGAWFLQNVIAPEYFAAQVAEAMAMAGGGEMSSMMAGMMGNPFVVILSSVLSALFIGGLVGLVVCAFVTRKPDVFGE